MVSEKAGSDRITSTVIGRPVLSTDASGAMAGVKIPSAWLGCESADLGDSGIARATTVQDIVAAWNALFI
jgi:hypothetical protein